MSSEPKDCPFCGGEGWTIYHSDTRRTSPRCRRCGCDLGEFDTPQEALAAWNRRAPEPATTQPERSEDAVDAARYRWLVDNADIDSTYYDVVKLSFPCDPDREGFNHLNEAIDAAMLANGARPGEEES
jgi:hypothetical protein